MLESLLSSFPVFCGAAMRIQDKYQRVVPLRLNAAQLVLYSRIEQQMQQRRPVRIVCLKARQLGISTFAEAFVLWKALRPNVNAMCVAHDLKSAARIFGIARFLYENLPPSLKPMKRYSSRRELTLENPDDATRAVNPGLRSRIEIRSAVDIGSGRGLTLNVLHMSEVALYPRPEFVWTSLSPAVPYTDDSAIILESTAHLLGGWWKDFWMRSKNGETGFLPVFLPWYLAEEYALSGPAADDLLSTPLSDYERHLQEAFGLTTGQLAWRRMKIQEMGGNEDAFRQDYPTTDEEAFIAVGAPLVPFDRLDLLEQHVQAGTVGDLFGGHFVPSPEGRLVVWEFPSPHESYIVGVDPSQGTETSDPSCVQVLSRTTPQRQVACWHGRIGAVELADIVEDLALWYNEAMVAPESDSSGITVLRILRDRGRVPLYRWRYLDKTRGGITSRYGWLTTASSKPPLVASLRHSLLSGHLMLRDLQTIRELRTFVSNERGSAEAAPGCHDDRVMALAIASFCAILDGESPEEESLPRVEMLDPRLYDTFDPESVGNWLLS